MAATLQTRRGRSRARRPMAEINVTPFVDVMLVLLIVFMVTAPLLTVGVPVDLPKTKAQTLGQDREPLSVTVRRNGKIYLQNTPDRGRRAGRTPRSDCRERLRPAHLRARRQIRRLWPRDGGDGPCYRRRLHPYRTGDRCPQSPSRQEVGSSSASMRREISPDRACRGGRCCTPRSLRPACSPGSTRWRSPTKARRSCRSIWSPSADEDQHHGDRGDRSRKSSRRTANSRRAGAHRRGNASAAFPCRRQPTPEPAPDQPVVKNRHRQRSSPR